MNKRSISFVFVFAFAGATARAQLDQAQNAQPTTAQVSPGDAKAVADFKDRLSDPEAVQELARRIARSSLGAQISGAPDEESRAAAIADWISANPDQAAGLGVGLARDDASGTRAFENALGGEVSQGRFVFNPRSSHGIYGRLRKTSRDSALLRPADENGMHAEEQSEIMRSLFEGRGNGSNRIITQDEKPPPGAAAAPQPGVLNSGYYDRLSRGNLHGYSPQLQALQSALNRRRPPGAPALIETGKLDYATLSFPGYGLRYDLQNLDARLRLERNYALAKALGLAQGLTRERLIDADFEARLLAQARQAGASLDPRFEQREQALARADAAARAFDQAAAPARDPAAITRKLVLSLGDHQKEAARWITIASLEDELQRLDALEGFLSAAFLDVLSRCPVSPADQAAYRRRGQDYEAGRRKLRDDLRQAVAALEADDWSRRSADVQQALDADAALRQTLERDVDDYVKVPALLAGEDAGKPRWRRILEDYVRRYLPGTSYGRELSAEHARRARLRDVFLKIAMGDIEAAHAILAAGG